LNSIKFNYEKAYFRRIDIAGWLRSRQKCNRDFFTHFTPEQNTYSNADQLRFLETVDTILPGRKTYELFVDFWPTATTDQEAIADKLNETKKIVFSNTLNEAPWGKWQPAEINVNAIAAIKKLKQLPGKNMVLGEAFP